MIIKGTCIVYLNGVLINSSINFCAYHVNLFDDREKNILLYKAIDEMKTKHGTNKVMLAQNLDLGNVKRSDPKAQLDKEAKKGR